MDDPRQADVAIVRLSAPFEALTVYLGRPAILTPIRDCARAVIANFGVSDQALLDVLTGRAAPEGTLPFELPSSMEAVRKQKSDIPYDSENPLFPFGHGLTYADVASIDGSRTQTTNGIGA